MHGEKGVMALLHLLLKHCSHLMLPGLQQLLNKPMGFQPAVSLELATTHPYCTPMYCTLHPYYIPTHYRLHCYYIPTHHILHPYYLPRPCAVAWAVEDCCRERKFISNTLLRDHFSALEREN